MSKQVIVRIQDYSKTIKSTTTFEDILKGKVRNKTLHKFNYYSVDMYKDCVVDEVMRCVYDEETKSFKKNIQVYITCGYQWDTGFDDADYEYDMEHYADDYEDFEDWLRHQLLSHDLVYSISNYLPRW